MRTPSDLHPDDRAARLALRGMLIDRREQEYGFTLQQLADQIGTHRATVRAMEAGESWQVATVQRWVRALGWRLALRPDWLTDEADPLAALRPADPQRADTWDRGVLVETLIDARTDLGVTQATLAERLGVTNQAVSFLELGGGTGLMLASAQRYCRALGGSLWIGVEDLAPAFEAVAA
jgi:transcriptional regulator with XRE-family HTH domain